MGDEMKYSEGQRNQIYEKYLRPLKLKISQILLYDTNTAADFLKKYNNLLQKTSDSELLDKITELCGKQYALWRKGNSYGSYR